MARMALEVRTAHQRPVDAGRGHFQPVLALDRIFGVEDGRESAGRRLAEGPADDYDSMRPQQDGSP